MVRDAQAADARRIVEIYNHYIQHTVITFEEEIVSTEEMTTRILETEAENLPWLVIEESGTVLGYAYASKWKGRCAYRHSVETTVYLSPDAAGRGLGFQLYQRLFPRLKDKSVHIAIGGIALPNAASIGLHEKCGMEKVAHFREVGFKFGKWVDVGYWQMTL